MASSGPDHLKIVRECYRAYETGDRSLVEEQLSDDFMFYSPDDVGIDRVKYFERCWPNSKLIDTFTFKRLVEVGDEVFVTYEVKKKDGGRFCNTEIHSFNGDKICRVEVYYGWDVK